LDKLIKLIKIIKIIIKIIIKKSTIIRLPIKMYIENIETNYIMVDEKELSIEEIIS